jgi:hypothetical protein
MKKIISNRSKIMAATAMMGSMLAFHGASASTTAPIIESFLDIAQHSVTFDVKDPDLKNTKARVKVFYEKETGVNKKTVTKKVVFDSNGEAKIKIKGLKADTTYKFKVEAKSTKAGSDYSTWSDEKDTTTAK